MGVKCFAQEHNTMSPARARSRNVRRAPSSFYVADNYLIFVLALWHCKVKRNKGTFQFISVLFAFHSCKSDHCVCYGFCNVSP